MENEKYLSASEVTALVGCSTYTLDMWYRFKRDNPDHELAKLLPEFHQEGARQKRVWKSSDVWKLIEFRASIPSGRNGVMGGTTQKYYKKKEKTDGRKKDKKADKRRNQRTTRDRKVVAEG